MPNCNQESDPGYTCMHGTTKSDTAIINLHASGESSTSSLPCSVAIAGTSQPASTSHTTGHRLGLHCVRSLIKISAASAVDHDASMFEQVVTVAEQVDVHDNVSTTLSRMSPYLMPCIAVTLLNQASNGQALCSVLVATLARLSCV